MAHATRASAAADSLTRMVRCTHSRESVREGKEVADDLIDAGKDLIEKCEDLYERSEELVGDAAHELSGKYRALHEHSKHLLDEAETILHRLKRA